MPSYLVTTKMAHFSQIESNIVDVIPDIVCGLQDMQPYLDWIDRDRLHNALVDFIMMTIFPWKQEYSSMRMKYLEGYYDFIDIWRTISSGFEGEDNMQVHIDAVKSVKDVCNWVLFNFHPK